ncbi:MAG TPA: cytochrome c oxidase subunit 4 [Jatrophihabitans sp.]|jgi:hypothetical protein
MKFEARLFLGIAAFAWVSAIIYAVWSYNDTTFNPEHHHQIEWAGFAALLLSGGLCGIAGSFFWFVSRRIDPRPEDRDDAEIAEAAGELGFFSPGSYWPLGVAAAAAVTGFGLAFVQVWLVIVGAALLFFMIGGYLFEYYIGGRRPAPNGH